MAKNPFVFTKEMAELLKKIRLRSGLSQSELAERIGLSKKTGYSYISHLEKGFLKNPSLGTILMYLRICGVSWPEFFQELDRIDFKMRHEKMISQLPPDATQKKIQRDAIRYEIGVEFPSKEKEEFDFTRLKKIIKEKVEILFSKEENTLTSVLSHPPAEATHWRAGQGRGGKEDTLTPALSHKGRGSSADYQKFASEFFDFLAALNKPGQKMVVEKYQRAGLERHIIFKIRKIIFSVIGAELKRIEAKKPLPTAKQERMAIGFTRYRLRMQRIESAVHKLLCELGVESSMGKFALYKDFARECYGILKKYYGKEILSDKFQVITKRWVKEGLKEDVLLKVRDVTIKAFIGKSI